MKNKTALVVFCSMAAILVLVLLLRLTVFRRSDSIRPKVITPVVSSESANVAENNSLAEDSAMLTSFIPLLSTENLINALAFDFDGDSFDDQVVAVYKAGFSNIFLIVGLYNPEQNTYERVTDIDTGITSVRTFSVSALDMIGNHRNTLVCQGMDASRDSLMKLYLCERSKGKTNVFSIGDFKSDGSIFIVQTERSEAYELSQARGNSYTVWVYSSDKTEEQNSATASISQIQTEYIWNESENKYTQNRQMKVTGSRLAARELSRIQNGGLETIAQFLDGLWYKTASSGSEPLYIYFDYAEKEVIFLSDDTEGVYSLEDSSLRRSGIYLTTANAIIPSMKRRFDIMITGVNEVYVHVHDDVRMVIKESNQWDGTYKKMSFQTTFGQAKSILKETEFEKILQESRWKTEDGIVFVFEQNRYSVTSGEEKEIGIYVMETVGDRAVLQFRSSESKNLVQSSYSVEFNVIEETVPAKKRGQKPTIKKTTDKNTVILRPVKISPQTLFATEGKTIVLKKES